MHNEYLMTKIGDCGGVSCQKATSLFTVIQYVAVLYDYYSRNKIQCNLVKKDTI